MGLPKISRHKRGIAPFVSIQRDTAFPALSLYLPLGSFRGKKRRRDHHRVYEQRGACLREANRARQGVRTLKKVTLMGSADQTVLPMWEELGMVGKVIHLEISV